MKPKVRILIVEDNSADAELAEYTLKSAGFDLISKVVETEGEYLAALCDFSPDIILSDYDMPMFSGADALGILKETRLDVPFILYTGAMGEERAIEILTSGATDYVMKNRLSRLVPAVERALAEVGEHKARKKAEAELRESHRTLEAKVKARTAELEAEIAARKKIEDVLRASEERHRLLAETMLQGVVHQDAGGEIIAMNPAAERILGKSREQFLGSSSVQEEHDTLRENGENFPGPEHPSMVALQTGLPVRGVIMGVFNPRLSDYRWISIDAVPVFRPGEVRPSEVYAIFEDITERKRAEETLRQSEFLLRTIVDNSPDPIFMTDRGGRYMMVNAATLAAIGKPAEQVIGKTEEEFLDDPETGRALADNNRRIMESGQTEVFEETIHHPHIGRRVYLSTKTPFCDQNGKVIGLIDISSDITEYKQMEEALRKAKDELEIKVQERTSQLSEANMALRQSEEKYRELVESAQSIILRMDRAGNITFINEFAEQFFGYSQQEALGRNVVGTIVPELESSGRDLKALLKDIALNPEKYVNNVNENMRKNGERVWISWTNAPINDARGKLLEVLCVGNDITGRKRMEERLRSARKNLRAMAAEIVMSDERARQHFAADLHDTVIQTMGAASMRSQLIQNDIPEKASKQFRELQDFISQSITQAKFLMAEMSPPVLNELGFIPALEWLAEQIENLHGINIEFKAADGFTPLQHEIQVFLFQATREILMNVVKHARADNALINVSASKQKIRIEVIDNGKGFDKRQAFRADVSSGGFGLFSIRERIRHFGGHLFIQSEEGKGTRVVMTAPRTWGGIKAEETSR